MMQQMKQSHDTYGSNQDAAPDAQLMPWSYRLPIWDGSSSIWFPES